MEFLKGFSLRSAVFGAATGVIFCTVVVTAMLWHFAGRSRAKPWNTAALRAQFYEVTASDDEQRLRFLYIVENTTDDDYRIDNLSQVSITSAFRDGSLAEFESHGITLVLPVFVPARQKTRVVMETPSYRIPPPPPGYENYVPLEQHSKSRNKLERYLQREQQTPFIQDVQEYVRRELPNLNGFVLFDRANRVQISFPNGWQGNQSSTEKPKTIEAPGPTSSSEYVFDVQGALRAGFSQDEILRELTSTHNFDVKGAIRAGYSKAEIIDYLARRPRPVVGEALKR